MFKINKFGLQVQSGRPAPCLQVPVPATKLAESEIVPARIAPQLRSASSSPHADGSQAAEASGEGPEQFHSPSGIENASHSQGEDCTFQQQAASLLPVLAGSNLLSLASTNLISMEERNKQADQS